MNLVEIRKALVAALVAGAGVAVIALENDGVVDVVEWIIIGVAVITGGSTVWAIPNRTPPGPTRGGGN